mgnify:FL=1|jgi:ParB-like chromosome segregation protein Spo0J|tara:strand:- start:2865 stop:3449 length:585 start_codon:yes stop_codon:yes gene_type:complete
MKEKISIKKVKENPENPRFIRDAKFKKLVKSIKGFPKMLEKRPIVVDENMVVLGGNMRLRACKAAGLFEVWIDSTEDWTDDEKKEFVIKDNVSYGDWDYDILANEWDTYLLNDWGLDLPEFDKNLDYGVLDDIDMNNELQEMTDGVKKALQIPFDLKDYQNAFDLVKEFRELKIYVGKLLIEKLEYEKSRIKTN